MGQNPFRATTISQDFYFQISIYSKHSFLPELLKNLKKNPGAKQFNCDCIKLWTPIVKLIFSGSKSFTFLKF